MAERSAKALTGMSLTLRRSEGCLSRSFRGSRITRAASKLEIAIAIFGLESMMHEMIHVLSLALYGNFNFKTIPMYLKSMSCVPLFQLTALVSPAVSHRARHLVLSGGRLSRTKVLFFDVLNH